MANGWALRNQTTEKLYHQGTLGKGLWAFYYLLRSYSGTIIAQHPGPLETSIYSVRDLLFQEKIACLAEFQHVFADLEYFT